MMLELENAQFAEDGNPHGNPDIVRVNASEGGNSAAYLAARRNKAGRDDLLAEIGQTQQNPQPWPGVEL
jgi:hypothetical protein